jgi:hypothetical protein
LALSSYVLGLGLAGTHPEAANAMQAATAAPSRRPDPHAGCPRARARARTRRPLKEPVIGCAWRSRTRVRVARGQAFPSPGRPPSTWSRPNSSARGVNNPLYPLCRPPNNGQRDSRQRRRSLQPGSSVCRWTSSNSYAHSPPPQNAVERPVDYLAGVLHELAGGVLADRVEGLPIAWQPCARWSRRWRRRAGGQVGTSTGCSSRCTPGSRRSG